MDLCADQKGNRTGSVRQTIWLVLSGILVVSDEDVIIKTVKENKNE
jgi:hypothetical protein